ncbi:MAG: hypothetical protein JWQ54_3578 [Mucilaginibacter sp.]|nr:hypothetical protein [Mucilaginibacter sp.]
MVPDEKNVTLDEYMRMPVGAPYQYLNGRLINWPSQSTKGIIDAILSYMDV